jgi:DoxX-like family
MNLTLWIIAGVLAAVFTASGLMKLLLAKQKLIASGFAWAQNLSPTAIRRIGVAEVLAAKGLILPAVLHIVPILVPVAAAGLVLVMAGAAIVHAQLKEGPMVIVNVLLLALAATVAWGRFGPYGFTG